MSTTFKDMAEYGALFGGLVAGVWYVVRRRIIERRNKRGIVKSPNGLTRDCRIHDMLVELKTETRADRIQIFQFHNGDHYDNRSSIRRFSCCYEVLKDGASSSFDTYQNCLVSGFVDGLRLLIESNIAVVKLSYKDLDNGLYKSTMIDTGVHTHIGISLKGIVAGEKRVTGLLLLSYNEEREQTACCFGSLVEEGHMFNTNTDVLERRECTGTCEDCRFNKYITRLETELAMSN